MIIFKIMTDFHYTRISENAQPLYRANPTDAGWDISYAGTDSAIIPSGTAKWLSTGISVAIPTGWYGRVAPRSGLAYRNSIDVLAGVVDSGYRGEVRVGLQNHGNSDFVVNPGDRIAQLIMTKISTGDALETDTLPEADRGDAGFGSTGV
jgi:dUTP pyrophosphatase